MSNSKSSSSSDRIADIMLQVAITAVVAVGVNKIMKSEQPQSNKDVAPLPTPAPAPTVLAKIPSHSSIPGQQQREDEREYKIERHGTFSADSSLRSLTWFKNPTWHIPSLEREKINVFSGIDNILSTLTYFNVSPHRGFLPADDPLQRLPLEKYYLWEDMADDLPKLLSARLGQVREPLSRLPVISTAELTTEGELRRAHLLLCLFAHAFVWGGTPVMEFIPKGISIPLWEVSTRLDVPPVLMNMDITLYNWRRLDPQAGLNMMNLSTLNSFFSGRDESWFYLITVEVEAIGAEAIVPLLQINADIKRGLKKTIGGENYNVRNVTLLEKMAVKFESIADCIDRMSQSLGTMREGCHPFIFYHRVRPFLAGWKANPALPNGLKYEGVYVKWEDRPSYEDMLLGGDIGRGSGSAVGSRSNSTAGSCCSGSNKHFSGTAWEPSPMRSVDRGTGEDLDSCPAQYFSGGSAAQTALFPFLDLMFGVDHAPHDRSKRSGGFIKSMRQYMPRSHRMFLEHMDSEACIRTFMCACQEALITEQANRSSGLASSSDKHSNSNSSSDHNSSNDITSEGGSGAETTHAPGGTPPWVWKENRTRVQAKQADGEGLDDILVASLTSLCGSYNKCLASLSKLRSGHMSLVHEYIIEQQKLVAASSGLSIEKNAGGKGTGGTDLMHFLKPMRDNCNSAKVLKSGAGLEAGSDK